MVAKTSRRLRKPDTTCNLNGQVIEDTKQRTSAHLRLAGQTLAQCDSRRCANLAHSSHTTHNLRERHAPQQIQHLASDLVCWLEVALAAVHRPVLSAAGTELLQCAALPLRSRRDLSLGLTGLPFGGEAVHSETQSLAVSALLVHPAVSRSTLG